MRSTRRNSSAPNAGTKLLNSNQFLEQGQSTATPSTTSPGRPTWPFHSPWPWSTSTVLPAFASPPRSWAPTPKVSPSARRCASLSPTSTTSGFRSGSRRHDDERCDHRRRSEEHTSELQSLMRISYAVFCLKKKKKKNKQDT